MMSLNWLTDEFKRLTIGYRLIENAYRCNQLQASLLTVVSNCEQPKPWAIINRLRPSQKLVCFPASVCYHKLWQYIELSVENLCKQYEIKLPEEYFPKI